MAIKAKSHENFSDENIENVIDLLEKGETKKSCCDLLGMSYNTSRLNKIIEEYIDRKDLKAKLKKSLRNKPLEDTDITYICQTYLNGGSLSEISENIYRSANVVKNVLKRYNIPLRNASNTYFNPVFIDDEPQNYSTGDLVYSARYNSMAEVIKEVEKDIYRICILGDHQRYALQPNYELGDLRKVQNELGITSKWETDTRQRAWQSILDSQKRKKRLKDER